MLKALTKCKAEGVTFAGVVVSSIVAAFYHAAKSQPDFNPDQPFKLMADLDYNMRGRVPQPPEEDPVGAYLTFADLNWLANEGVDVMTTSFWDLDRRAKNEIDGNLGHRKMVAKVNITLDQILNAKMDPAYAKDLNIRHSQTSDANISSIGKYPYAKELSLVPDTGNSTKKSVLSVKDLHIYNSIPHLGPSVIFFVSSVESFCYSMGHRCEDEVAKVLFTAWVANYENIGNIDADSTLVDVLRHLNF